jgi:lipopolysaccharide/colanic/teichoic acid biosynthesis glycosyltransferase
VVQSASRRAARVRLAAAQRAPDLLDLGSSPVTEHPGAMRVKRALDVFGASVGLVALAPLLAGVALAIALDDGPPVLFRQPRAGLYGRPFSIAKFRTMRKGADAERAALRARNEISGGAAFKLTHDPRVTRLGHLLRRTSLDEFPQLWNVLRGDMSLVGPRPHPFDDLEGYESWHLRRLAMPPGMTGLWQVSARTEPDFDRWVRLDLEYIDTWSLRSDLSILLRTVPAMLRPEGR